MSSDTRLSRDVCACFASFSSFFGSPSFLKSGVDKRAFLRTKDLGSERFSRIGNNPRRYPPTPDIWDGEFLFYSRFFASTRTRRKGFLWVYGVHGAIFRYILFHLTSMLDSRLTIYTIPANVFET